MNNDTKDLLLIVIITIVLILFVLFVRPSEGQVIIVIPPDEPTPTATATIYQVPATPQPDSTLLPFIQCKPSDVSQRGTAECCYEWRGNGIDPSQSYWHFLNCVR